MNSAITRRTLLTTATKGTIGGLMGSLSTSAGAEGSWPSRPVRLLCGYAAGGQTDVFARAYAEGLWKLTGQPFVVENKVGAGSIIACEELKKASPDGGKLLYTTSTALIQNKALYAKLSYDPDKDFTKIAYIPGGKLPFSAAASVPATNMNEFVAWAKGKPLNFGSYAPGGLGHLVCAQLNKLYDLTMECVQYRGEAPMWQDMAAGSLQAAVGSYGSAQSLYSQKLAKPLAVPTSSRLRSLPDVPTYFEQGFTNPIFGLGIWHVLIAPAGLDPALRERISGLMVEAGKAERMQKMLENFGIEEAASGWQAAERAYSEESRPVLTAIKELNLTLD
ncbi:Bug family tripartite tricarboxylate transporter substrate binding protein [Tardiphaga sp. 215_C5_N2_1]|uniref:Bug family tripartite tricarboxylate transporter substrate binding protein n=1 Tax=Tardiphaga sp. 215_C5_N2_1 TaxID=3240774 RepID=UPI003F89F283